MESILAADINGAYQEVFGRSRRGLFLQRIQSERFLFRHAASGLSLFYFLGTVETAHHLQDSLIQHYDFSQDSTWVLKGQAELHRVLLGLSFQREWMHRAWHYKAISDLTLGGQDC